MKHYNEVDVYVAMFGFQALAERFGPDVAAEYLREKLKEERMNERYTPALEPTP